MYASTQYHQGDCPSQVVAALDLVSQPLTLNMNASTPLFARSIFISLLSSTTPPFRAQYALEVSLRSRWTCPNRLFYQEHRLSTRQSQCRDRRHHCSNMAPCTIQLITGCLPLVVTTPMASTRVKYSVSSTSSTIIFRRCLCMSSLDRRLK